ncbi:hypothetical protein F4821DRAFT_120454 [Hypoxylon rubiginosum]|uniref:Uncharacterized protein n=1 Tax=Hypoxylon rubiginosum TaxID=110542 RepID=A0ACC0D324_9PEZI|nr:hypothetical protein F4821DRAFT_120454 [Hypoxylon rubiginosum]
MVNVDIDAFLQKGYWPTSRARSPDSRVLGTNTPSSRSSYVDIVPRRLPSYRPPPPKVEDESVAVAKEFGSEVSLVPGEEPLYKGDVEQYPILLPVHEHNPERRFVLVSTPSDSADDSSDGVKKLPKRPKSRGLPPEPEPTSYEANTCRRRPKNEDDLEKKEPEKKRDTGPPREKHRSKLDHLPAIVTDVNSPPRSPDKRAKSTARSEKGDKGDDYFSPRLNSRLQNGTTLSPDVIEHGSRGRERGYYHGGTSPYAQDRNRSAHPNVQYEKSPRDDRRYKDKNTTSTKPPSPTHHKRRSTADLPQQLKPPSKVDREKGRQYTEPRSPGVDRNGYSRSERDNASQVSSGSTDKRGSPPSSEYYYSSDEEGRHRIHAHRRHESDTKAYLGAPIELKPGDKRRSRASSPLPSPRVSQVYEKDYVPSSSPRSSTFPKDIRFTRNEQRTQPPLSRTSTGKSVLNATAPIAIPVVAAAAAAAATARSGSPPVSHRQSAVRPPSRAGSLQSEPRASAPKLSSSPQRQARQPIDSSPLREVSRAEQPIFTTKRYLDEIRAGKLPDMQYCPRRKAVAGCVDWLTLPRCDNFNICPSCYEAAFADTEFAHHFVPMPFRPADRPIACDFGTSRFYHIAYFLMSKHRKADLSLFRSIANIAAQGQPCAGPREISRTWFSVRDPRSARPIETFNVCGTCAGTVVQLLPNLTGIFVPLDSPAEPTRGVCAMHQQNERRFMYYFDLLEAASDKALLSKSTPDVQALADRLRDITEVPECVADRPVRNGKWYTMLSLPDFTVCEECFGEVVWPMIRSDNNSIAANFMQSPEFRPLAACQLYSPRMRQVFGDAVHQSDIRYLANKLREREDKEREFHARIVGLDRKILGDDWINIEVERAQREWAKWE